MRLNEDAAERHGDLNEPCSATTFRRMEKLGTLDAPVPTMEPATFVLWVEDAPPGEWAVYWEGDLNQTRFGGVDISETRTRLARIQGQTVWRRYEAGDIWLFQRRKGRGFQYLAVKRECRRGPTRR